MPDTPTDAPETEAASPDATDTAAPQAAASDFRTKANAAAGDFRAQATDRAMAFAEQGKTRASGALDELSRLIGENARQVDGAVGEQYGDYVRRAADAVSAFSGTLRDKDMDELMEDTRAFVRQSPALALGAAAAAGFFLARVVKSGSEALDDAAREARSTTTGATPTSGRTA